MMASPPSNWGPNWLSRMKSARVVGVVENAEPLTLDPRSVPTPARYVLELGAGVAKESGIDRGVYMDLLKPEDDAQRPLR